MKSFDSKIKISFIAALTLASCTIAVCCLVVIIGARGECVGRQWLEGYRPIDFFGLSLFATIGAAIVGRAALGPRAWRGTYYKIDRTTVKVEDIAYGSVIGMVMSIAIVLGVAIFYGHTILIECLSRT